MEAKCFRGRQLEVSVSHHGCLTSAFTLNMEKRNHAGKHLGENLYKHKNVHEYQHAEY